MLRHYACIFAGVPKENRRGIFRDLFFTREHLEKLRIRVFTEEVPLRTSVSVRFSKRDERVTEYQKIGATTHPVYRICSRRIARIEMSCR